MQVISYNEVMKRGIGGVKVGKCVIKNWHQNYSDQDYLIMRSIAVRYSTIACLYRLGSVWWYHRFSGQSPAGYRPGF